MEDISLKKREIEAKSEEVLEYVTCLYVKRIYYTQGLNLILAYCNALNKHLEAF